MKYIIQILVNALAVIILAKILPGIYVDSMGTAVWVAFALSVLNMLVKPLLIIFTLPITVLSLGVFLLVINAIIINMAAYFVTGFDVGNLFIAFVFSLLLSILQSFLSNIFGIKES